MKLAPSTTTCLRRADARQHGAAVGEAAQHADVVGVGARHVGALRRSRRWRGAAWRRAGLRPPRARPRGGRGRCGRDGGRQAQLDAEPREVDLGDRQAVVAELAVEVVLGEDRAVVGSVVVVGQHDAPGRAAHPPSAPGRRHSRRRPPPTMTKGPSASAMARRGAASGSAWVTRARPSSIATGQTGRGSKAGAFAARPEAMSKQAWCQGQRSSPPTRRPFAIGAPRWVHLAPTARKVLAVAHQHGVVRRRSCRRAGPDSGTASRATPARRSGFGWSSAMASGLRGGGPLKPVRARSGSPPRRRGRARLRRGTHDARRRAGVCHTKRRKC